MLISRPSPPPPTPWWPCFARKASAAPSFRESVSGVPTLPYPNRAVTNNIDPIRRPVPSPSIHWWPSGRHSRSRTPQSAGPNPNNQHRNPSHLCPFHSHRHRGRCRSRWLRCHSRYRPNRPRPRPLSPVVGCRFDRRWRAGLSAGIRHFWDLGLGWSRWLILDIMVPIETNGVINVEKEFSEKFFLHDKNVGRLVYDTSVPDRSFIWHSNHFVISFKVVRMPGKRLRPYGLWVYFLF